MRVGGREGENQPQQQKLHPPNASTHHQLQKKKGGREGGEDGLCPSPSPAQVQEACQDLIISLCLHNDLSYGVMARVFPSGILCMRCAAWEEREIQRFVSSVGEKEEEEGEEEGEKGGREGGVPLVGGVVDVPGRVYLTQPAFL